MTKGDGIVLPPRPFLYTVDQIATLLSISERQVKVQYLWYKGRSAGARGRGRMVAVDISPDPGEPEWRVSEAELLAWMKRKGFHLYERSWVGARAQRPTPKKIRADSDPPVA